MQDELDALSLPVPVHILGINEAGQESANALMVEGRDLPWLQDTLDVALWDAWDVTYRDVVILDGENRPVAVYNLTEHNLGLDADYEALRDLFVAIAESEAVP